MKVRLIAVTQPEPGVFEDGEGTCEDLTTYIARVSNPENQANKETYPKLIGHLIGHKHWSPFDMTNMVIEVVTSKAISIQILRHWSIHPQEFSQRYAVVENIEDIKLRTQAVKNRQSSIGVIGTISDNGMTLSHDTTTPINEELQWWLDESAENIRRSLQLYKKGIELGIAKECARMILPMATATTMYLNGTIRSWMHYMDQRCDHHAQKEHRLIAEKVKIIFEQKFPNIFKAYENKRSNKPS